MPGQRKVINARSNNANSSHRVCKYIITRMFLVDDRHVMSRALYPLMIPFLEGVEGIEGKMF